MSYRAGFPESPYSQYSPQSLPQGHLQQQSVGENAASQMNQLAYAANNAAAVAANNAAAQSSYNFGLAPSGFSSQGSQPGAGPSGSKIQLRISGQYDIMQLTSTTPYAWVLFGNAASRTPAQIARESPVDASGACTYSITVDAPAFMLTNWTTTNNVPLSVVIESADGNELARVGSAGSFTYTDSADVVGQGAAASPPDEGITRSVGRSGSTGTRTPPSHEHETHGHGHIGMQVNSPLVAPSLTVRTSASTSPTTEHGGIPGGVVGGVGLHPLPHHGHLSQHAHHQHQHHDVSDPTGTNTYGYPPPSQLQVPQAATQTTSFGAYGQGNDTMLHAYRTSNNYAQHHQQQQQHHGHQYHHQRSPTSLRSPHHGLGGWASYGGLDGRGGAGYSSAAHHSHHSHHHTNTSSTTSITRPSLTPSLPMPSGGPPALVRTTSLPQGNPSSMGLGGPGVYSPFGSHHKAVLHIQGNLEQMIHNWTGEEYENKRRIVIFKKTQSGSRLTATFRAVPVNERPPNSICISCIWWEERQDCYVTSVDTIHLLEQLVAAPNRFTVEEKNRIRRNLEGFKPLTVSKAKSDSEDFFKIIMGFGNPKPRNIEKDVKVFPWKILAAALKKIISKYSASPSSTMPHHHGHPSLLTPVSVGSSYGLPPTPTTATDPSSATGYLGGAGLGGGHHGSLSESMPSPRSLTGGGSGMHTSWATAYSSNTGSRDASRALSPTAGAGMHLKTTASSPISSSSHLRLSALPASAYGDTGTRSSYGLPPQGSGGGHHAGLQGGHNTSAATGRWDYSVNAISDTTGAYGGGGGGGGASRGGYDYGGYGDGASQRA